MTVHELKHLLQYNPVTGRFRWLKPSKRQAPSWFKGNKSVRLYRRLYISGRHYLAHVVAWALMTGEWPSREIDHRNRKQGDNRWENFRLATHQQNGRNRSVGSNSSTGVVGVTRFGSRFRASISYSGKRISLGVHPTVALVVAARRSKALELYADFAQTD